MAKYRVIPTHRLMPVDVKLRALGALKRPTPHVVCDNGDNTTYTRIIVDDAMLEWLSRHPEALAPAKAPSQPSEDPLCGRYRRHCWRRMVMCGTGIGRVARYKRSWYPLNP